MGGAVSPAGLVVYACTCTFLGRGLLFAGLEVQEHVTEGGMWSSFSRNFILLNTGLHPALPVTSGILQFSFCPGQLSTRVGLNENHWWCGQVQGS